MLEFLSWKFIMSYVIFDNFLCFHHYIFLHCISSGAFISQFVPELVCLFSYLLTSHRGNKMKWLSPRPEPYGFRGSRIGKLRVLFYF